MNSCAAYLPCHSVDYHQASSTCYYSNHHGEPTISTPSFGSAYSLDCTGACSSNGSCASSCCGCSTTARKPPGPPTPDLSCGNQGVLWAIYPNKKADGVANTVYADGTCSTFDPARFKPAQAEYTGKSKIVAAADVTNIYGNHPSNPDYVTVNHRGHLFARKAGEYTFTNPSSDDITLLWVGPTAYSGWTRANARVWYSRVCWRAFRSQ
jgi:hypothetical protein